MQGFGDLTAALTNLEEPSGRHFYVISLLVGEHIFLIGGENTRNQPRGGMRRDPATAGRQIRIALKLAAARGFAGGVAGAEPLHKGGPKARPPRTAVVSGQ